MKTFIRPFISLLGIYAGALPLVRADHSEKLRVLADAKSPDAKFGPRVFIRHGPAEGEMETVAFLGVETAPVTPSLTAQLGLPKDAGLIVRHVVPASPAASMLQTHDILLKLDDQLLIEPRQFSVLVRNHKEGDEIELTYVRAGKQTTAKVKLGKHEAPKMAYFNFPDGAENFDYFVHPESSGLPHEEMDRVLSLLDREQIEHGSRPHHLKIPGPDGPGFHSVTVNAGNSNMVYSDDQGSLELTLKEGKKTLLAKDSKGAQLFSGPIDEPEQRKALPEAVRERLDKLESMQDVSFHADDDFEQGEVKIMRPAPGKISLPLPPPPTWSTEVPPPTI
jgi:serine protease Do